MVKVTVPPLRDRREDIPILAKSFLASVTGDRSAVLPPEIADMLASYGWPGNVRELRNVVQRFAALGVRDRESLLGTDEREGAKAMAAGADMADLPYHEARQLVLDRFERGYVDAVLAKANGVVIKAAEQSGVPRATFYRMLERLGIRAQKP